MQHNVRGGFDKASSVGAGHYGSFPHGRMRNQSALDLSRTEPTATHFEQIVGASYIPKISVSVLVILVAGVKPGAFKRGFRFLVLVPVTDAVESARTSNCPVS